MEHVERVAAPLGTRQVEAVVVALVGEPQLQALGQLLGVERVGRDGKDAAPGVVGLEVADAVAPPVEGAGHVQRAPLGVMGLEGHAPRHVAHQVAAFGVEVHLQPVLDGGERCGRGLGQPGHAPLGVLAPLHPLVDGEHAAEDAGVALDVALYARPPLPQGFLGVHAPPAVLVAGGEVEHPGRVGAHLVETGVQRVLQFERAVGLAVLDDQLLRLHGVADGVEQLDVEDAAQVGVVQVVVAHDVGLVPDALAFVVGGVVEVQVDALRGKLSCEALEVLLPFVQQRVSVGSRCRRQACEPGKQC